MSRGRNQTHRRDANHKELLDLARQLGGYVHDTSQTGHDAPDAHLYTRDKGWAAIEIKSGQAPLRPGQVALQQIVPVLVWRTAADVLAYFGVSD